MSNLLALQTALNARATAAMGEAGGARRGCPLSDLRDRLRRAGLRPTRQRLSLGWLLFGRGDRHLTADLWRPYGEVEALEVPFLHPQMISPEAVVLIAPMLRAAMDRAGHRASPRSAAAE